MWGASLLACYLGDLDASRSMGEEALAIRRPPGCLQDVIQPLNDLGLTFRAHADCAAVAGVLEEAMTLCPRVDD